MTSVPIIAKLENTKGKEFRVKGRFWANGAVLVANPRPERYKFTHLYTEPEMHCEAEPKRLYWVTNVEDFTTGELSPFSIKTIVADAKLVKKLATSAKK